MSALVIRPATEADLPGVLALHAQPDLDAGAVLEPEAARDLFRRFALYPDYVLYVAEDEGGIVGTHALLVMDNFGHLGARSAVVEGVAVAPDRQSAGIGAAMMRHAMAVAAEKGCYKLALSSGSRRTRAHAFYEGLGFARHGVSFHVDLAPPISAPPVPGPLQPAEAGQ